MFNLGLEAIQLNRLRKMYHASPIENLPNILKNGLVVHSKTNFKGFFKPVFNGIYLSVKEKYFITMACNYSKQKRALLATCRVAYKDLYVDEDELVDILAFTIPTEYFNKTLEYKTYTEKEHILTLVDILNNPKSVNKVVNILNDISPVLLRDISSTFYETLRMIYVAVIKFKADSSPTPSRHKPTKSNLRKLNLSEDDIDKVISLSENFTFDKYRQHILNLVMNSNKCIESFLEIEKNYDKRKYKDSTQTPKEFIYPKNIGFLDVAPYIEKIDEYKLVNKKAAFVKNIYTRSNSI